MRSHHKLVLTLSLGMLFSLVSLTAHAGDPPAFGEAEAVVGSWQAVTNLGTTVLFTFHPDQTFNSSFQFPNLGAGNGHGAWTHTGLFTYAISDVGMILDADNELAMFLTVEGTGTVRGDDMVFAVQATLSLPDGTVVDSFPGEVYGKRIQVAPTP